MCLTHRRSSGYSRDYEGDRGRGSGFDSYGSRGYDQREDRRGFGSNYDQDERRGSFRDRPKGDYGKLLQVHFAAASLYLS